jgi:hypothetical protein
VFLVKIGTAGTKKAQFSGALCSSAFEGGPMGVKAKSDLQGLKVFSGRVLVRLKRFSIAGLIHAGFKRIEKRFDITTF